MNRGRLRKGRRSQKPSPHRRGVHTPDPRIDATVGGIAKAAGVTTHVVRYYTRIGLLNPLRDASNNYKRFNGHHLSRLRFIRGAQALGYTLAEIRRIVGHAEQGHSPCPEVRDILKRRIGETHEQLANLQTLQLRMERALQTWKKMEDGTPDGHSVCVLIESMLTSADHKFGIAPGQVRATGRNKAIRRKKK